MALSPTERTRLVNIPIMLGSDHDGERAAAAALASRMVRDKGLTWDLVISDSGGRQDSGGPSDGPGAGSGWRDALAFCQRHTRALSDWEAQFVGSLHGRRAPPTLRQTAKLHQIADTLRARSLA